MSLFLRLATPNDASALSTLAITSFTETFGHLYSAHDLATYLREKCSAAFFKSALEKGDHIVMAWMDETLAGYGKAGKVELPVEAQTTDAEIHRLYVLSPFHGKGVADALMESMLALPALSSACTVYLGVWENNLRAQRFYARYGFIEVAEYLYYVGNHTDRELILAKSITSLSSRTLSSIKSV